MEDSNANRGDGTVVLILKTARDWELSLGTSRLTRQPQALEFGLKFILNLQLCSHTKGLGSLSLHTDWLWRGSWLPRHLLLDACFSACPGRPYRRRLFSEFHAEVSSLLTTGEVLDLNDMKAASWSVFSLPLLLHGPQWFHLRHRTDLWLHPT